MGVNQPPDKRNVIRCQIAPLNGHPAAHGYKYTDYGGRSPDIFSKNNWFATKRECTRLNFFDGLKKYYPQVSIDWLISGYGNPFIEPNEKSGSIVDLQAEQLVKKFGDKDFALEINHALVALEKASMKEFYKIGGYIKAIAEQGAEVRVDCSPSMVPQENEGPWDGSERRSGTDRRKSAGE